MTRIDANKEIMKILSDYVNHYPSLRFEQILLNLNLDDVDFYRESTETLKIIKFAHDGICGGENGND